MGSGFGLGCFLRFVWLWCEGFSLHKHVEMGWLWCGCMLRCTVFCVDDSKPAIRQTKSLPRGFAGCRKNKVFVAVVKKFLRS